MYMECIYITFNVFECIIQYTKKEIKNGNYIIFLNNDVKIDALWVNTLTLYDSIPWLFLSQLLDIFGVIFYALWVKTLTLYESKPWCSFWFNYLTLLDSFNWCFRNQFFDVLWVKTLTLFESFFWHFAHQGWCIMRP